MGTKAPLCGGVADLKARSSSPAESEPEALSGTSIEFHLYLIYHGQWWKFFLQRPDEAFEVRLEAIRFNLNAR